jgi:hypothetical protein
LPPLTVTACHTCVTPRPFRGSWRSGREGDDYNAPTTAICRSGYVRRSRALTLHEPQPHKRRGDVNAPVSGVRAAGEDAVHTSGLRQTQPGWRHRALQRPVTRPRLSHTQNAKHPAISKNAAVAKKSRFVLTGRRAQIRTRACQVGL